MTRRTLALVFVVLLPVSLSAQGRDSISLPAAREKALADAARLSSGPQAPQRIVVAVDPFAPPPANLKEVDPSAKDPAASTRSAAELVALLAERIQPSGSMMLGGEPYLLFTERRQKIGDKMSVALEGVEYSVEIVSISNNRFRIRYQDREAERTIK